MPELPSILKVLAEYVPIEVEGHRYASFCPFHDDRAASLEIFVDRGRFLCHECRAQGDAADFIAKYEQISREQAIHNIGLQGPTTLVARPKGLPDSKVTPAEATNLTAASVPIQTVILEMQLRGEETRRKLGAATIAMSQTIEDMQYGVGFVENELKPEPEKG
jgi:hypothetical protein